MAYNYPIDTCTSQNDSKTYSVESHLTLARTADGQSPLKVYHQTFSLYKHSIVEKDSAVKAVYANTNVKEMEDIFKRTDYAFAKSMDAECVPPSPVNEELSLAYTVKITSGILKGKTPAEVLLENPNGKEALNNQYKWLKTNLEKYPNNKKQMDAILDASRLFEEHKLKKAEKTEVYHSSIRLYPSIGQPLPKPLRRKTREDGKSFIYEMEIFWHIGDKFPIEIVIRNYWAPVNVMEDKTLRIGLKDASDKVEKKMRLTEADWLNHIREIKTDMKSFEYLYSNTTRTDSINTLKENIAAANAMK